jgi:hypothetical protein
MARTCPPVGVARINRSAGTGHNPSPERSVSGDARKGEHWTGDRGHA